VERLVKEFGTRKIDIAIISEGGKVSIKGGAKATEITPLDLALQMTRLGVSRILYGEREDGLHDKHCPMIPSRTSNQDRCSHYSSRRRFEL